MRLNTRCIVTALILLVTACTSTHPGKQPSTYGLSKTRPDPLMERRVVLAYPYTSEKIDLIYFHNSKYDEKALARINTLFRDRHANVIGNIDPELIDYMVDLRTRLGLPPTVTFQILSGYRTRETNARLAQHNKNVALESTHMHGWAVDFRIDNVDGRAICEIAKTMQRGGVAYYPTDNHVHVDLGNIRTWQQK